MTAPASTWAPLRAGAFRTLWIAALVSNVREWMQTVGAQWLLVHDSHADVCEPDRRPARVPDHEPFLLAGTDVGRLREGHLPVPDGRWIT